MRFWLLTAGVLIQNVDVCSFKYAPTRLVTHDASTWRSCDYLHLHERSITRIIALYKRCMAVYRRSTERPLGRREVAELRRRDARRVPCSDCRVYPPGFTNRVRRRNPLASSAGFTSGFTHLHPLASLITCAAATLWLHPLLCDRPAVLRLSLGTPVRYAMSCDGVTEPNPDPTLTLRVTVTQTLM